MFACADSRSILVLFLFSAAYLQALDATVNEATKTAYGTASELRRESNEVSVVLLGRRCVVHPSLLRCRRGSMPAQGTVPPFRVQRLLSRFLEASVSSQPARLFLIS